MKRIKENKPEKKHKNTRTQHTAQPNKNTNSLKRLSHKRILMNIHI